MSDATQFKVEKTTSPPRIVSIRGHELPKGAMSSPGASKMDGDMISDFAVRMVSAAFQWAEESRETKLDDE